MTEKPARVLDVGNCDPDHAMIRRMLTEHFDVAVDRVMFVSDALERMRRTRYELVLFNRLIFADGSEGISLLEQAQSDETLKTVPIMMISNYDDAQRSAVAAGGVRGFGKSAISDPATIEWLARYLPPRS